MEPMEPSEALRKRKTLGMLKTHEVANATGLHESTIRNLDSKGIIKSVRDMNGWRGFDPSVVPFIQRLYGRSTVSAVQSPLLAELAAIRVDIEKLRATVPGPLETLDEVRQQPNASRFVPVGAFPLNQAVKDLIALSGATPNPDGTTTVYLLPREPVGKCGHPFSVHERQGVTGAPATACNVCACGHWCEYVECAQCGGPIEEGVEGKCEM